MEICIAMTGLMKWRPDGAYDYDGDNDCEEGEIKLARTAVLMIAISLVVMVGTVTSMVLTIYNLR